MDSVLLIQNSPGTRLRHSTSRENESFRETVGSRCVPEGREKYLGRGERILVLRRYSESLVLSLRGNESFLSAIRDWLLQLTHDWLLQISQSAEPEISDLSILPHGITSQVAEWVTVSLKVTGPLSRRSDQFAKSIRRERFADDCINTGIVYGRIGDHVWTSYLYWIHSQVF